MTRFNSSMQLSEAVVSVVYGLGDAISRNERGNSVRANPTSLASVLVLAAGCASTTEYGDTVHAGGDGVRVTQFERWLDEEPFDHDGAGDGGESDSANDDNYSEWFENNPVEPEVEEARPDLVGWLQEEPSVTSRAATVNNEQHRPQVERRRNELRESNRRRRIQLHRFERAVYQTTPAAATVMPWSSPADSNPGF